MARSQTAATAGGKAHKTMVKFLMRPKENSDLQRDVVDRMGAGVLPVMVKKLYLHHRVRLLGISQRLAFFLEASEDVCRSVLQDPRKIQDILKEFFSREVQHLVSWEELGACGSAFQGFQFGLGQRLPEKGSEGRELRVVLLGKTGCGKSSLGNTLLGREAFRVARGMSSGTDKCEWADQERDHTTLQVTDTPGLCDTHRSDEEILVEVAKSISVTCPGPHAVIMVFRCDRRFTNEEYQAYLSLKNLFGPEICKHMIVVFTGAESLIDHPGSSPEEQEQALQRELEARTVSGSLQSVLKDVDNRWMAISNQAPKGDREKAAIRLLRAMQVLVERNDHRHYNSRLMEGLTKMKEPLIQKYIQENTATHQAATKAINVALVEEKAEETSFFRKVLDETTEQAVYLLKSMKSTLSADMCSLM